MGGGDPENRWFSVGEKKKKAQYLQRQFHACNHLHPKFSMMSGSPVTISVTTVTVFG